MDSQFATKVLLVDDEVEFINLMAQRLETRGLKVVSVNCGEEAVKKVDDRNIDVAVVDLAMPGINGIETLRRIKKKRPDIEVIMLTGHATVHSGIDAMKQGAVDYLEKPVDLSVLMEAIRSAKDKRMEGIAQKSADEVKHILHSKSW